MGCDVLAAKMCAMGCDAAADAVAVPSGGAVPPLRAPRRAAQTPPYPTAAQLSWREARQCGWHLSGNHLLQLDALTTPTPVLVPNLLWIGPISLEGCAKISCSRVPDRGTGGINEIKMSRSCTFQKIFLDFPKC